MAFVSAYVPWGVVRMGPVGLTSNTTLKGSFLPSRTASVVHNLRNRNARPRYATRMDAEINAPPIDLPSSVLLLTSSVLAIASVGCVFELTGGNPSLGPTLTSAILAGSLPGFIFLFYAAVRKGQQEAMEDD